MVSEMASTGLGKVSTGRLKHPTGSGSPRNRLQLPRPNAEQRQSVGPEGPEGAVGVGGEHDAAVGVDAEGCSRTRAC